MAVRSSWMKSENFQPRPKLPSCVFCRSMSLNVSAGHARYAQTFGGSPPRTVTCRLLSALGRSVAICFTVCMCFRLKFLLFENEKRTSVCWLSTLSIATHGKLVRTLRASTKRHSDYLSHTLGPETYANCRTSSNDL